MGPVPATPKRFEIVDIADSLNGSGASGLMQLAQMSGGAAGLKMAKCDGAVWIGKFLRDTGRQSLNITTCLFPYQGGYSLNVYGQDTHKKSGMFHRRLVEGAVSEVLGKSEKWTQKTFSRMRRKVYENTGVLMQVVEGQPTMDFSFEGEPQAMPAESVATKAPLVDCTGLSDAECGAAFRAAAQ